MPALSLHQCEREGGIQSRSAAVSHGLTQNVYFWAGAFQTTQIGVYEVNRKWLLGQPESGGMVEETESESSYLPSAGNDYTFASPQSGNGGASTPLVVKLRTRCAFCHGDSNLTNVMTFAMKLSPKEGLGPAVRQLNPETHEAADFVVSQKTKGEIWKTLRQYFEK